MPDTSPQEPSPVVGEGSTLLCRCEISMDADGVMHTELIGLDGLAVDLEVLVGMASCGADAFLTLIRKAVGVTGRRENLVELGEVNVGVAIHD